MCVYQTPCCKSICIILLITTAIGGDVTATTASSQQSKSSQSQSGSDSSQVDGTQPVLHTNMNDQLLCESNEQSLLHKNFQAIKSKQLLKDECQSSHSGSSGVSESGLNRIKCNPSVDHAITESLLKSCEQYFRTCAVSYMH